MRSAKRARRLNAPTKRVIGACIRKRDARGLSKGEFYSRSCRGEKRAYPAPSTITMFIENFSARSYVWSWYARVVSLSLSLSLARSLAWNSEKEKLQSPGEYSRRRTHARITMHTKNAWACRKRINIFVLIMITFSQARREVWHRKYFYRRTPSAYVNRPINSWVSGLSGPC